MITFKKIQFIPDESEGEEDKCDCPQNQRKRIERTFRCHGFAINNTYQLKKRPICK